MDNINIYKSLEKTKKNKIFAMIGVLLALLLSFVIIGNGIRLLNNKPYTAEQRLDKSIQTIKHIQPSDTACCALHHKAKCTPVEITEKDYSNTDSTLLYISTLVFIFLSLWGTFTVLVKILKSENEINLKILEVEKDIYKEQQMWVLTKEKNVEKENEINLKYKELEYNKRKFTELEQLKETMKHLHEIELKKLECKDNNREKDK